MSLKGYRTKISAFFSAIPALAMTAMAQYDVATVINFIQDNTVPVICYQAVTYILTHYYRNQATVDMPEEISLVEKP